MAMESLGGPRGSRTFFGGTIHCSSKRHGPKNEPDPSQVLQVLYRGAELDDRVDD
jgi:hypothetical protein